MAKTLSSIQELSRTVDLLRGLSAAIEAAGGNPARIIGFLTGHPEYWMRASQALASEPILRKRISLAAAAMHSWCTCFDSYKFDPESMKNYVLEAYFHDKGPIGGQTVALYPADYDWRQNSTRITVDKAAEHFLAKVKDPGGAGTFGKPLGVAEAVVFAHQGQYKQKGQEMSAGPSWDEETTIVFVGTHLQYSKRKPDTGVLAYGPGKLFQLLEHDSVIDPHKMLFALEAFDSPRR